MLRTFNCGVGMLAVVPPEDAEQLIASLTDSGERSYVVGALVDRADAPVTFEGSLAL